MKLEKIPPFQLGDQTIDTVEARKIGFQQFVDISELPVPKGMSPTEALVTNMVRHRLILKAGDKQVPVDETTLEMIPAKIGLLIYHQLSNAADDISGSGEVLAEGDALDSVFHYKLGTPLRFQGGKSITELEFKASSMGRLMAVITAPNDHRMILNAIEKIAKPVGIDNLKAVPSTAIAQVSLADGIFLEQRLLPLLFAPLDDSPNE